MIDFSRLEEYRENNRIEAKKALGGLPHSIWETYSAFANTLGGIILLGVEEYKDRTLHTVNLPDPQRLVGEFWDMVNDPNKASANVLSRQNVRIETVGGDRIIVIDVPRAQRFYRPVYVGGNPVTGSYRRNGEGDYHCTMEEYQAMVRDASVQTQDMRVLRGVDSSALSAESIRRYRARMRIARPGHIWESLDNEDFLLELGATGVNSAGETHPTAAGLLMFGSSGDIAREYPSYSLSYRGEDGDCISSGSGDWSGNLFDFFRMTLERLLSDTEPQSVRRALREALANCIVNADYYGRRGIEIVKRRDAVTLSNPGEFRIAVDLAKSGGLSDPRNGTLMKMFNLIDVGEHSGSGIPNIFYVWKQQGWSEPTISQSLEPASITFTLPLCKRRTRSALEESPAIESAKRHLIIDYLTDNAGGTCAEIAEGLELRPDIVRSCLRELTADGIVEVTDGEGDTGVYKLKY